MRRSTLVTCALLAIATSGCDKVKPVWDTVGEKVGGAWEKVGDGVSGVIARVRGRGRPATPARTPDTSDRASASRPPAAPPPSRPAAPPPPRSPTASLPVRDQPFVSSDTGTIDPGMSERDVYSLWGPPLGVRRAGEWTYLYFRNGCEYSCGTYDVVFLQSGVVVDAVLRWPGHNYSGQSSSPPGVVPLPTRGGDSLIMNPPEGTE